VDHRIKCAVEVIARSSKSVLLSGHLYCDGYVSVAFRERFPLRVCHLQEASSWDPKRGDKATIWVHELVLILKGILREEELV